MMHLAGKLLRLPLAAPQCLEAKASQGIIDVGDRHLLAASSWLLQSQRVWGQRGYAHSYHLLHGWQPPYPETTGYLIPTLHRLHLRYGIPELAESVTQAAQWLAEIQLPSGAFADLAGNPQVFDSGQILIGLNYLAERFPAAAQPKAQVAVARWLAEVQEADGSFVRYAYHQRPHTYYSRVGAALLTAGRLLGEENVRAAGLAQLDWVLAQQLDNGFFQHASFDAAPAFLHTIVYIVEGLLDAHGESGDERYLHAALRSCRPLLAASSARDLILRSQYAPDFSVANPEKCLTGLAQWAGVCLRLARLTGDAAFRQDALKTLYYLKSRQLLLTRDLRLYGGLLGSDRLFGKYMMLAIPNWGLKFFIDALLLKLEG